MKKILAIPAFGAVASFASGTGGTTAPSWWPSAVNNTVFDGVLTSVAPIAIAVVVGVAGVRVAIKLINRGAGK